MGASQRSKSSQTRHNLFKRSGASLQTPRPPPQTVDGGSVKQGLSDAYELFSFCLHRFAADKRYLSGVTMKQSTEVLRDVYLREVQYALFHFQMIEEGLKTYISEVH